MKDKVDELKKQRNNLFGINDDSSNKIKNTLHEKLSLEYDKTRVSGINNSDGSSDDSRIDISEIMINRN